MYHDNHKHNWEIRLSWSHLQVELHISHNVHIIHVEGSTHAARRESLKTAETMESKTTRSSVLPIGWIFAEWKFEEGDYPAATAARPATEWSKLCALSYAMLFRGLIVDRHQRSEVDPSKEVIIKLFVTGSAKTEHNNAIQIFQYKALKHIG